LALREELPGVVFAVRHGINERMNFGLGGGFIIVLVYLWAFCLLTWRQ
jgi:hypothetical protein